MPEVAEQQQKNSPKTQANSTESEAKEETPRSVFDSIVRGPVHSPPRVLLYGVHGIGKSTLAAGAPKPIFICTEEGANEIEVDKFPVVESRKEVLDILRALYRTPRGYKTIVLDSADWLEDFINRELLKEYTEKELAYGREALYAEQKLAEVLAAFNMLRLKHGFGVIVIAHSEIKRFDSPLTEPFDRYQPKLTGRNSSLLQEWADAVLFATYDIVVKKEDVGFNRSVRRGESSGDRIMYTEERPGFYAKNRYKMPLELPLKWGEFAEHIPYYKSAPKGE